MLTLHPLYNLTVSMAGTASCLSLPVQVLLTNTNTPDLSWGNISIGGRPSDEVLPTLSLTALTSRVGEAFNNLACVHRRCVCIDRCLNCEILFYIANCVRLVGFYATLTPSVVGYILTTSFGYD